MDEVRIRAATTADIDDIHALEQQAFPEPWKREFFEAELRASGRFHLVVLHSGTVIAYLFAMWFFDEMHVNKIAVEANERRSGVATILMERCFAFAREHQIHSISLEVRASNEGARAFYRRIGFADTYVRPRYYPDGEAAVVMARAL